MKIVWLINGMTAEIANRMEAGQSGDIGWVTSTAEEIRKHADIQLYILYPQRQLKYTQIEVINHITYIGFYQSELYPWKTNVEVRNQFKKIIDDIVPDVIHIWGTEYAQSLDMVRAVTDVGKIVVHVQGLISVCAEQYMADLPFWIQYRYTFRDILRNSNMKREQVHFTKRGKNELYVLKNIKNVMGRTDWDKAHCLRTNPHLRYFHCNESMRQEFFEYNWQLKKAEKYTVFIAQATYPVKGFHFFLKALSILTVEFPQIRVRIAGASPVRMGVDKIRENSYGRYIRKYIEKHRLIRYIEFLGYLDVKEMIKEYLHANVFVVSSAVENSPNSLAEAMVLGVPCIAADVGGIGSMIKHNETGFLYQHNDSVMLAYYIAALFKNDSLSECLSAKSREKARISYDAERNVEKIFAIYEQLIDSNR